MSRVPITNFAIFGRKRNGILVKHGQVKRRSKEIAVKTLIIEGKTRQFIALPRLERADGAFAKVKGFGR